MRTKRKKKCEVRGCKFPAMLSKDGHQEKYCSLHRSLKMKEMKRAGYLTHVPRLPWATVEEKLAVEIDRWGGRPSLEDIINASSS